MKINRKASFIKFIKREIDLLKNIEISELDFKESGQWPLIIKLVFMALTFAIIIFIGNNVHVENLKKSYTSEKNNEKKLLDDVAKYSYVQPTIVDYRNQLEVLEEELESIKQKLPEKIEMSPILDELTQLAIKSNVIVDSINLEVEIKEENYIVLPFKIKTKGKFHAFASFLSQLAKMNRIVTVHEVSIVPSKEKDSSMLEMEFIAKTYKYYNNLDNLIEGGKK